MQGISHLFEVVVVGLLLFLSYRAQFHSVTHLTILACLVDDIMFLGRAYQPPQRRPMDLACHHLETITIMTRKDDKGDQPSGGETTWTNTGATRYGRGQNKTG